jgi:hypothetical protein
MTSSTRPSESTVDTQCRKKSETHQRPACHRGASQKAPPSSSVRSRRRAMSSLAPDTDRPLKARPPIRGIDTPAPSSSESPSSSSPVASSPTRPPARWRPAATISSPRGSRRTPAAPPSGSRPRPCRSTAPWATHRSSPSAPLPRRSRPVEARRAPRDARPQSHRPQPRRRRTPNGTLSLPASQPPRLAESRRSERLSR